MSKLSKALMFACCLTLAASTVLGYSTPPRNSGQGGCPSEQTQADWHMDNVEEFVRCLGNSPGDFCAREYEQNEAEDALLIAMLCS